MNETIPLPILRDLLCRHCNNFVSNGPVHVVPDGGILCGRCRVLAKSEYRNFAYEAIASLFTYPCCNWTKNCPAIMLWNRSDHELRCVYNSQCSLFFSKPSAVCKSPRKMPYNGDIRLEHITEEIIESLKCVLCECYLSCDPVYITFDNRNLCHRCITSNGVPPQRVIRNLSYEKIASITIFPCIYRHRGCTIRLKYGREMWRHESECSYGQIYKKVEKKPSRPGAKERGVIQTHSGHIYATITPNSALFAPPPNHSKAPPALASSSMMAGGGGYGDDSAVLNKELNRVLKDKGEIKRQQSFDSHDSLESILDQSVDSTTTRRSTEDIPDYTPSSPFNKLSIDGSLDGDSIISGLKLSRDDSFQGYYRENLITSSSRPNSRPPTREDDPYKSNGPSTPVYNNNLAEETKWPQNLDHYAHLSHFPAIYMDQPIMAGNNNNLAYSRPALLKYPDHNPQIVVRSDSLRVGNKDIINELKARNERQKRQSALLSADP